MQKTRLEKSKMQKSDFEKIKLSGLLPEEITQNIKAEQNFRGKQIFKWIGNGAETFDEMTNLPADFRKTLAETCVLRSSKIINILKDSDGAIKLQIELCDKNIIETVLLVDKENRKTACVSCQAGCAMKCAFCMTGTLGLARNLEPCEIVEQFLFLEKIAGKLDNIVFMGMGEPMQNLDAVRKAILILSRKDGRALSSKRITISTCGVVKGIYDLADNGPRVRLAVSLTTADEDLRKKLMPICAAKENSLEKLRDAIDYYAKKSGKRVTLQVALLRDKNTDLKSAEKLINFAKNANVNVNLISWNEVDGLDFKTPDYSETENFLNFLKNAGLNVTLRKKRGQKIGGACGQLGKIL